ncbi:MAG: HD domain-containing protein [Campylobacteraceae bacterium]|nr:HD domain-containing protein [Campylobacteraceae bacterium]
MKRDRNLLNLCLLYAPQTLTLLILYPILAFIVKDIGFLKQPSAFFPVWLPAGVVLLYLLTTNMFRGALIVLFVAMVSTHIIVLNQSFLLSSGLTLGNILGIWVTCRLIVPHLDKNIFEDVALTETYLVAILLGSTIASIWGNIMFFGFGLVSIESLATGVITFLVSSFLGMLLLSSPYIFIRSKEFKVKLKQLNAPLFWGNTILTALFSYYLLTSDYLSHAEFFVLVPLLIILLRFREYGLYVNGFLVFLIGLYAIFFHQGLNTHPASYSALQLQTFIFFVFSAGYILAATLNQGRALLKHQEDVIEETLITFARFIEEKDAYTAGHSRRVADYSVAIAKKMGLPQDDINLIHRAGLVHDIGKIITPESILLKPGNLTSVEYALMKQHASVGAEMIGKIGHFKPLAKIVRHHHEWVDGNGYPDGLKGDEIPLPARILCISDAFDAMTTNRIYKPRKSISEAIEELESKAGTQFDSEILKYAIEHFKTLKTIQAYEQDIIRFSNQAEAERFSYFFKDSLTGLFNTIYFNTVLMNSLSSENRCYLHVVCIKGMGAYNNRFGWTKGDELLRSFGSYLQQTFPDALLFRAYGDDFLILRQGHKDVEKSEFDGFEPISDGLINLAIFHLHLGKNNIYDIESLENILFNKEPTLNQKS